MRGPIELALESPDAAMLGFVVLDAPPVPDMTATVGTLSTVTASAVLAPMVVASAVLTVALVAAGLEVTMMKSRRTDAAVTVAETPRAKAAAAAAAPQRQGHPYIQARNCQSSTS